MINLDFLQFLHSRFRDLLTTFMPGLFFEIIIVLTRPDLVQIFTARTKLGPYSGMFTALVLAFIVGNVFICWSKTIKWLLGRRYQLGEKLRHPSKKVWLKTIERVLVFRYRCDTPVADTDAQTIAWHKAATRLLKFRYGITAPSLGDHAEWEAWKETLGVARSDHFWDDFLLLSTQATGWSALAAVSITYTFWKSHHLYSAVYLGFAVLSIGYSVARERRWIAHCYRRNSQVKLRAVLDEIRAANLERLDAKEALVEGPKS